MKEENMTGREFATYVMWSSDIGGEEGYSGPNFDIKFCKGFLREMTNKERRNWAKEQLESYARCKHSDQFYGRAVTAFLAEFDF